MTIYQKSNIDYINDVLNTAKVRAHVRQLILRSLRKLSDKSDVEPATERCLEPAA